MNTEVGIQAAGSAEPRQGTADAMLATAEAALNEYVQMLVMAKEAAAAGDVVEVPPAKDVRAEIRNYSAAYRMAVAERNNLGKIRHQTAGTVGGRTLDLDAARVEIGRRLACLRDR